MPVRNAFTLIEVTITLCILSVLSAIAMPWAGKLLDRVRVRAAVVEVESLFAAARHIAISRAATATVDIDTADRVLSVSVGNDTVRTARVGADHDVSLIGARDSLDHFRMDSSIVVAGKTADRLHDGNTLAEEAGSIICPPIPMRSSSRLYLLVCPTPSDNL